MSLRIHGTDYSHITPMISIMISESKR